MKHEPAGRRQPRHRRPQRAPTSRPGSPAPSWSTAARPRPRSSTSRSGRTQIANITMSLVVLVVVLFLTGLLTDMPKAVLAAIVFLIGLGLIDIKGLRRIRAARRQRVRHRAASPRSWSSRWGVEQGIILAIVAVDHRARPPGVHARRTSWSASNNGGRADLPPRRAGHREPARAAGVPLRRASCSTPTPAGSSTTSRRSSPRRRPGALAGPGLLVDRTTSTTRPASPWQGSSRRCTTRSRVFALAGVDPAAPARSSRSYGPSSDFDNAHIYPTVQEAVAAFRADSATPAA